MELDLSPQGFGKLQVRQQQNFKPVPLKQIQDSSLPSRFATAKVMPMTARVAIIGTAVRVTASVSSSLFTMMIIYRLVSLSAEAGASTTGMGLT